MKANHVYREANRVVDDLASLGHFWSLGLHIYFEALISLKSILSKDVRGLALPVLFVSLFVFEL